MKEQKIPVYEVELDEAEGIFAVSLVGAPAMQKDWMVFSEEPINFAVQDEEQRKVMSVLIRANYPILRKTPEGRLFYIIFRKEVIEKMVRKMMYDATGNNIDLNHDNDYSVEGVELEQVFIKDSKAGINPVCFQDLDDGSAVSVYHIVNDEIWDAVRRGVFNGISMEAYVELRKPEQTIEDLLAQKE